MNYPNTNLSANPFMPPINPELECNWDVVLPVYNSYNERVRVTSLNPNIRNAVYPLTRNYLNSYFSNSQQPNKSSFDYDCAASMYSFFLNYYGKSVMGSGSNFPFATGAGASTGFNVLNPFGLDLDFMPNWLWLLLLIGGGAYVIKKVR